MDGRQQPPDGRFRLLAETLQLQATILDQIHDSVVSTDFDGTVLSWNKGAERLFGYRADEAIGRHISFVYRPEDHRLLEEEIIRPLLQKGQHEAEVWMVKSTGENFCVHLSLSILTDSQGRPIGMIGYSKDITEQRAAEETLRRRARQQAAVAGLGQLALTGTSLPGLLQESVSTISKVLEVGHCKVLELEPDGAQFLLVAGTGWGDGQVGQARIDAGPQAQAGFTLLNGEPVVVEDFSAERRFGRPELLRQHAVMSGVSVLIPGRSRPYGVLGAHSVHPRSFSGDDIHFLQGCANVLSAAIERRRAEGLFRDLLESAPDAMVISDQQGRILHVNSETERLFGYDRREILGKQVEVLVPESYRPSHVRKRERYFEAPERRRIGTGQEIFGRHKDGRWIPVEVSLSPLTTGEGLLVSTSITDITDRRKAEQTLREQAELLNHARDAILVHSLGGRILYWNLSAEKTYGWTAAEVLGLDVRELLYASDRERFDSARAALLERGEWNGELSQTGRDSQRIVVRTHWSLVQSRTGEAESVLSINTDVTETKKLEAQVLRAQRLESVGTLAGGLAHDLGNILSPIVMAAEMLKRQPTEAEAEDLLSVILSNADRGSRIIKQVLTFARGMEGKPIRVHPRQLIAEVASIAKETFPRAIHLETHIAGDLAAVKADPTQIHQMLMNLCVNSRDAMPEGGVLSISAENADLSDEMLQGHPDLQPGPFIRIAVRDTGCGIDREALGRIFEPFFTTKPQGKGSGLGLASVLGIAKGHGGFVELDSRVGSGTEFRVFLPAAPEEEAAPRTTTSAQARGDGELVLIVEDEPDIRRLTRRNLEVYGYRTLCAADGNEALALYLRHKGQLHAVVTDLMMPGLGGIELIRSIRRIDPAARIIVTSGLLEGEVPGLSEKLANERVLRKPFALEDLLAALSGK